MKKIVLLSVLFLCFLNPVQAQQAHLKLIHDFEGNDFDYSVIGMVGTNDSLYVICFTPPYQHGMFFRIDANGDGYEVIWEFDNVYNIPNSIVGNENDIYITTRFGNGGALFKYSLTDYSFKRIKDFAFTGVGEASIKYVTDSVLWYTSTSSNEDAGSVFSTNLDGTGLKKLYASTNPAENSEPSNFFFHENKVYIAFWGGGNLDANSVYCGNFIRVNIDGSGYEKIIPGSSDIGAAPQSLVFHNNKMIGLFAYSGFSYGGHESWAGRVFRSNLDGSDYEPLGSVGSRSFTNFLSTPSLIYGVTTFAIYGINPHNGKIRMYEDFLSNPDFGVDVVSNPVYLNGDVFIAAQQGGPNGGGTIIKWLNARPEVHVPDHANGRIADVTEINLNELFVDPNEDPLTFSYEYNQALVTLSESNGILTLSPLTSDPIEVKITATDGWAGYAGARIKLNPFEINVEQIKVEQSIAFNAIVPKKYGDAPFTLSANASSTLPITFTSSDNSVLSVTGNNATILKAGTVMITASQAGDETHYAAPTVSRQLIINKANQEISFNDIPVKQSNSDDFNLIANASSGLPISFTSDNEEVATIDGTMVSIIGSGTALITAAQSGNDNYIEALPVSKLLTIELITGIASSGEGDLTVFPNPTDGLLQINGNVKEFMLIDIFGKTIKQQTIDRSGNTLDVRLLPGGIYFLKIIGSSSTKVVRIVKQ